MTTAAADAATERTVPEGLADAALHLARTGPVVVVTDDDDATALATGEIARLSGGSRLEGLRTTTSPVLRRAVRDRLALGQVDVVVVSDGAWEASLLPGVPVVDARTAPAPGGPGRYVLCRLGAR
jgi:hypothetical protein